MRQCHIQNFFQIIHTLVDIPDTFLFCFIVVLFALNLSNGIIIPTLISTTRKQTRMPNQLKGFPPPSLHRLLSQNFPKRTQLWVFQKNL